MLPIIWSLIAYCKYAKYANHHTEKMFDSEMLLPKNATFKAVGEFPHQRESHPSSLPTVQ